MNIRFLHHRLRTLEELLARAGAALRALSAGEPAGVELTTRYLADAATAYASLGMPAAENECLVLLADVVGVRRGPAAPGRRRAAEQETARQALAESSRRLRAEFERDAATLDAARDEIGVLVHHAVENGLVDAGGAPAGDDRARAVWRVLVSAQSTRSAARLLALRVAVPDVLLLIEERTAALAAAGSV
jgi:hypothetical protein